VPNVNYIVAGLYFATLVMSIVLHEVAHGWMARRCGDHTAEAAGRLTLNPIPHIDPIFTILMPIITMFASGGGLIFGGAKPVPVNPYFFRNLELDDLKVSVAGVAVNFSIALGCGLTLHVWPPDSVGYTFFTLITIANLALGFFNLIPIPPLDGSHVARFFLAKISPEIAAGYERIGMFGLILVIMLARFFSGPIFTGVNFVWFRLLGITGPTWYEVIRRFWSAFR
jgi:Zn-dependent protease